MPTIHSFSKSLEDSKKDSKDKLWNQVFELLFPGYEDACSYDEDMLMQKSGVDDLIRWQGRIIWIDRKFRKVREDGRVYHDVALEYLSDEAAGILGWICKDTKADYWIYLNRMNKSVQLIPVEPAQAAWKKYETEWAEKWPFQIRAYNNEHGRKWTTISRGIPVDVLDEACKEFGEGLRILSNKKS